MGIGAHPIYSLAYHIIHIYSTNLRWAATAPQEHSHAESYHTLLEQDSNVLSKSMTRNPQTEAPLATGATIAIREMETVPPSPWKNPLVLDMLEGNQLFCSIWNECFKYSMEGIKWKAGLVIERDL
jgi:hypothetical protein